MATLAGLEPAISAVTGRHPNHLDHRAKKRVRASLLHGNHWAASPQSQQSYIPQFSLYLATLCEYFLLEGETLDYSQLAVQIEYLELTPKRGMFYD